MTANNRSTAGQGNTKAKAGRAWEDLVTRALADVPGLDVGHFGAPTRILGVGTTKAGRRAPLVAFEGPAPLDYCGNYFGRHFEADAKRCQSGSVWQWSAALSTDQVARAHRMKAAGCMVGIFLLIDDGLRCYGIAWRFIARMQARRKLSVTADELNQAMGQGEVWALPMRGGRPDVREFIVGLAGETNAK